jgi:hypothetical protein
MMGLVDANLQRIKDQERQQLDDTTVTDNDTDGHTRIDQIISMEMYSYDYGPEPVTVRNGKDSSLRRRKHFHTLFDPIYPLRYPLPLVRLGRGRFQLGLIICNPDVDDVDCYLEDDGDDGSSMSGSTPTTSSSLLPRPRMKFYFSQYSNVPDEGFSSSLDDYDDEDDTIYEDDDGNTEVVDDGMWSEEGEGYDTNTVDVGVEL